MEHDVFISYSSVNAQVAQAVCHVLVFSETAQLSKWVKAELT